MRKGFWTADWFAGLIITIVLLVAGQTALLQSLERAAYDWGVRLSSSRPSENVAVIAIDNESIANIGRWPWSRDVHAGMISKLKQGGAKVVGNTVFFLEPQIDPGLQYIEALAEFYAASSLYSAASGEIGLLRGLVDEVVAASTDQSSPALQAAEQLREFVEQSRLTQSLPNESAELAGYLVEAAEALNTDAKLAAAIEHAANVVLAMPFVLGEPRGNPDNPLPEYVTRNALLQVEGSAEAIEAGNFPIPSIAAIPPIPELGEPAAAIGHLNATVDIDGGIRSEPLVIRHYDTYYPSLSLQIAARSLNVSLDQVKVSLGDGVRLKDLYIRTDPFLQMQTYFYRDRDGNPAFDVDSFFDVQEGKIPAEKYRDKIVLIGATATGVGTPQVTPVSPAMAPVLTLAHSVSSILNEDFFVSPRWSGWAEAGVLAIIALYLILLLPRMRAGLAFIVSAAVLIAIIGAHLGLMTGERMWLQLMLPATLLLVGHILLTTKRFLMTERGKLKSDADSAESNRMLGLAYQGKGDLDAAFASFRKVKPMDESVMDLLYNLALDYERKRQHNKAGSVYQHMAEFDPNFRDLKQRVARSRKLEETVMLGGAGATTAGGTLLLDGDDIQKPMLGRYQVEKELGKGAMGVVYLGRDPKINRVVAIKTMALSQEFEEDELDEVKERFFREAETAGRLNHPNIVTIFDAGEEHDLAYIAMEFLKGKDLAPYTKPDNLLPLAKVMEIVALAADALTYAHSQNVVHRDIKPANIMYEEDSGSVKLTDFGIARITDSSKTKTGMVLGTPSYMSPEQLSGKKVDGRSDLFSLGVMLFQLASGELPFKGDSMATLMFKIANEEHPDVTSLRSDLPPCMKIILDKALKKVVEERYQNGADMARDVRACMASLSS